MRAYSRIVATLVACQVIVWSPIFAPALTEAQEPLAAIVEQQIAALQAEKESRTPGQRKMDSRLVHASKKQRGVKLDPKLQAFEKRIAVPADGLQMIDIRCEVTDGLIADLKARGGEIIASVPRFRSIRARLPLAQVEAIALRDDVQFITPAVQAMTHVGAITTEGDVAHRANIVRSTLNATGRGVRIGVLSDSVDHLTNSQISGELGPVTILPGQNVAGSGEGTAMLEIIHDLVPDAELFFATAFISEAQFAQNILDLRAAGCDIVVDDVAYFDESPFQDGPVAQAVNEIVADGGLYFSSAGNEGNKNDGTSGVWEGDFVDAGPTAGVISKAGRLHSFGATAFNTLTQASGLATLFWADPAGASSNDYDLYVLDATGTTLLGASTNIQSGHQDPYEIAEANVSGSRLVIVKSPSASPRFLHLNTLRGEVAISTSGTIQGHAAAAGAIAVAATTAAGRTTPFTGGAANPVESFSTDGDRRVFFNADGTALTPGNFSSTGGVVRLKPDLTAADGVRTSVPGFDPFFGTSAAAPHAAAIAAQIWSRNRTLTPQQVRAALMSTALDIEALGRDRDSGVGIVTALPATQSITGGAIISSTGAVISAESYAPANGRIDPGETITVNLTLQNVGPLNTTNLTATLLSTGGIFNPTGPQSYGSLNSGTSAARSFTFQGTGPIGGTATATFELADGANRLGVLRTTFVIGAFGATTTFSNPAVTTIPSLGVASPYPSAIVVSGFPGAVGKITVRLNSFTHTFPSDLDILLVSPSGRKVLLMSDAGGGNGVSNVTLTFDDAAANFLGSAITTGTFKPTVLGSLGESLNAPAPVAPYQNTLSTFAGQSANGTWQLWVRDQFGGDSGSIASWSLSIAPDTSLTGGPAADITPALSQSSSAIAVGAAITYTATVTNNGASTATGVVLTDVLPTGLTFSSATTTLGSVSNVAGTVTANIGTLTRGQAAVVTIVAIASTPGTRTNTVNVSLAGSENTTANNSSRATVFVGQPNLAPTQPPGWSGNIVVSTSPGTTTESNDITGSESVFLDFSYANLGTLGTNGYFTTELFVDGVLRRVFEQQVPLRAGSNREQLDIPLGTFAPGIHSVQLKVDTLNGVLESSEADNVVSRTFVVSGANLAPTDVPGASGPIIFSDQAGTSIDAPVFQEGDSIYLDYRAVNNGTGVTGALSVTKIFLDGTLLEEAPVASTLAAGATTGGTDLVLGPLAPGMHTVRIVLDADANVAETEEGDNAFTRDLVVNARPTITSIGNQVIDEDRHTGSIGFTIADSETPAGSLVVTASSSNIALFPAEGIELNGSSDLRGILLRPAAHEFGISTVTVTVLDQSGGTASATFQVTVSPVNDAPTFGRGQNHVVLEDTPGIIVAGWASSIRSGPLNENSQQYQFIVSTDNDGLFSIAPAIAADGTLSFTPAPNANGIANIQVILADDAGTEREGIDRGPAQTFTITILAANDPPSFQVGATQLVAEDSGPKTVPGFVHTISPGPPDESDQIVSFFVSSDNPALFSAQPAVSSSGTLAFAPASNANGSATVTIRAQDSGGTSNNGSDSSAAQVFVIEVGAVDDAPTFVLAGAISAAQDAGPQRIQNFATDISPGAADEAAQTVSFTVLSDDPGLFAVSPSISAGGLLTFTPNPSASGQTTVTVTATDSNGVASEPQSFTLAVTSFAEEIGTYNGLVTADGPSATAAQTGTIAVVVSKSGRTTGRLLLGGQRHAFKGFVLQDGRLLFGDVPSTGALSLKRADGSDLHLNLALEVAGSTGKLRGSIINGSRPFGTVHADRVAYNKTTNPAPSHLIGRYTVIIPARTPAAQGLPASAYPQGSGFGTMKVSRSGVVKLSAVLPDATKISATSTLSATNETSLFAATASATGAIAGRVAFADVENVSDAAAEELQWFSPAGAKRYPRGWPNGISVDFLASRFVATQGTAILPGLPAKDADGNAILTLEGGGLAEGISNDVAISKRGTIKAVLPNDDDLRLELDVRTGLLSGSIKDPTAGKILNLRGAAFQKQQLAAGFFLRARESGSLKLVPAADPEIPEMPNGGLLVVPRGGADEL
jgi:uncharacterized repeat protein (TIGR01451 family)